MAVVARLLKWMPNALYDRVLAFRSQQDNEQWHLLILEELIDEGDARDQLERRSLAKMRFAKAAHGAERDRGVLRLG